MTFNRAAFDNRVKGSRISELGEHGVINSRITTLKNSIEHFTNQLPRIQEEIRRTEAAGNDARGARFDLQITKDRIEQNRTSLIIATIELRNLGPQQVRVGDTGQALSPGQDRRAFVASLEDDDLSPRGREQVRSSFSTRTAIRGSGNFDPNDPGTGLGQDVQIGTGGSRGNAQLAPGGEQPQLGQQPPVDPNNPRGPNVNNDLLERFQNRPSFLRELLDAFGLSPEGQEINPSVGTTGPNQTDFLARNQGFFSQLFPSLFEGPSRPGFQSQLTPTEGPFAGVGGRIGASTSGTTGPLSAQEQAVIMGQIQDSIIRTGNFDTGLLSQLSADNQLLATQFWGQVRQATIGEDQFGVNTQIKRQEIGLKFLQDQVKNDLAEGKFVEAKRTQEALENFQQQQLGLDQIQIAQSATQFNQTLNQRITEFKVQQQQLSDQLELDRNRLAQQGDQFDETLLQRIAEAEQQLQTTNRSLDLQERGLTIEESLGRGQLALGRDRFGFEQEQGRATTGLARDRFGLETELGRGQLGLGQAGLLQQGGQFGQSLAQTERLGAIANPFGFSAANILSGRGGENAEQAPFVQGLRGLGFQVPEGARAGEVTPSNQFFSGGLPTLGALNQAGSTAQAAVQPFLSFTGTSPQDFQRQSAAITPRARR